MEFDVLWVTFNSVFINSSFIHKTLMVLSVNDLYSENKINDNNFFKQPSFCVCSNGQKFHDFLKFNIMCICFIVTINFFSEFSKAQRALAKDLMEFKFECIGNQLTDDEIFICK